MTDGLPKPRRYLAIVAISLGTALVVIDGAVAAVALPTIADDLAVDNSAAVLVVTVYQLVLAMTLLPMSNLGDRVGLRKMYMLGLAMFSVSTAFCLLVDSLPLLLIVRAMQALGAAAALSVSSAIVRQIYPAAQLGRGMGINSIVVSSAAAFAPTLGGLILGFASWPWIFAAATPFALLSLLLARALPPSKPRDHAFDIPGAVLCAATFGLIITGLESAVHGRADMLSAAIVVAGIVIGFLFIRREIREPNPILPVDLLARPILALSSLAAFAAFVGSMTVSLSLPFRLEHAHGFSPGEIGAMLAAWPLTIIFVAPIASTLSDRIPAGALGGIGMGIATIGLFMIAFLPAEPDFHSIAARMALTASGFGLFLAPNARLIVGAAPIHRAAAAGGLVSTTRIIGQTTGATLVAALLSLGLGDGATPALVAAGLALVAGICSVARLRPSIRHAEYHEPQTRSPGKSLG